MNIVIRILNSLDDEVEISWQSSPAIENYRKLSKNLLGNFLESWETFLYKNSIANEQYYNASYHIRSQDFLVRELTQKSITLCSLLFGKFWKKGIILPNDLNSIQSFRFITEVDWTGIPFEVLSLKEEEFSPISMHYPVRRSIRSQNLSKSGKKGKGILYWLQESNSNKINESVNLERVSLEKYWEEEGQEFFTYIGRSYPTNHLIELLNQNEFLYFAGHTEPDYLPLQNNGKFFWKELANLDLSNLRMVFFNSCYSSIQNSKSSGLVTNLLEAGVANFIGFSNVIDTKKAEEISLRFWQLFLRNKSLDKSILELRNIIQADWGKNDLTPYTILHYSQDRDSLPDHHSISKSKKLKILSDINNYIFYLTIVICSVIGGIYIFFSQEEINSKINIKSNNLSNSGENRIKTDKKVLIENKNTGQKKHSSKDQDVFGKPLSNNVNTVENSTNPTYVHVYHLIESLERDDFKIKIFNFLESPSDLYSNHEKFILIERILINRHETEELKEWKFQKIGK